MLSAFPIRKRARRMRRGSQAGLTLLELILTCGILLILSGAALPIARYAIVREKEAVLRHDLDEIRDAIDRYKDAADHQAIHVEIGTEGYPPDLQTLVTGVKLGNSGDKKIVFLPQGVPIDPMTGRADWGLRAVQDDVDSKHWSGKDVFDVYSQSTGTAMDGTKYSDW